MQMCFSCYGDTKWWNCWLRLNIDLVRLEIVMITMAHLRLSRLNVFGAELRVIERRCFDFSPELFPDLLELLQNCYRAPSPTPHNHVKWL